jgi:hypothetical protein
MMKKGKRKKDAATGEWISDEALELRADQEKQLARIGRLIDTYEVARSLDPCDARDHAELDLEEALRRHGRAVRHNGRIYRWSREEHSLYRLKAV